jgi:hypothetical protein
LTSASWNKRMFLYLCHQHAPIYALLWRMCHRASQLHNISPEADANRYTQYVLMSLCEVEAFTDKTTPSDRTFRPLGDNEWMGSEGSRPDMPYRARPFYATGGFTGTTSTKAIVALMGNRKHRFAVDPMGLSEGFREALENLNGGSLNVVEIEHMIMLKFQRQLVRPHRCQRCGSGNHMKKSCLVADKMIKCIYPRCKSNDHLLAVCPLVIERCTGCETLGHRKEDHPRTLWPVLYNDFIAAACFHDLAIFTCERLSITMGTDAGEFVIIPEIDYKSDSYVSKEDRRRLSTLKYDIPY